MVNLQTPRLSVVISEDADAAVVVQTINADMVLAERTARKHGWGKIQDSPMLMMTFMAWAALRRKGLIASELTWEQFEATCASLEDVSDAADDDDDAGPTPPDLVSG